MGLYKPMGHGEVPDASHATKIIVKPCAGKRHARFERGLHGNGSALSWYRAIIYQRYGIVFVYCGDPDEGEQATRPLREFGPPSFALG